MTADDGLSKRIGLDDDIRIFFCTVSLLIKKKKKKTKKKKKG